MCSGKYLRTTCRLRGWLSFSQTIYITETPCMLRGWHSFSSWLLMYPWLFCSLRWIETFWKLNQLSIVNELNFPPAATLLYLLWGFGQKQTKTIIEIICAPPLSSFWGINNQEIASVEWKDQWVLVKSGIFKWLARWRLLFGPLRSIYFISIKSLKDPS